MLSLWATGQDNPVSYRAKSTVSECLERFQLLAKKEQRRPIENMHKYIWIQAQWVVWVSNVSAQYSKRLSGRTSPLLKNLNPKALPGVWDTGYGWDSQKESDRRRTLKKHHKNRRNEGCSRNPTESVFEPRPSTNYPKHPLQPVIDNRDSLD